VKRHITDVKRVIFLCIFVFTCFSVKGNDLAAEERLQEEIQDKYPAAAIMPPEKEYEEYKVDYLENFEVRGSFDLQQGFDNNVDLDSKRHKDGFLQAIGDLEVAYKMSEELKLKAGGDIFSILYYKYNSNNIFDIEPYVGFDYEIIPGLVSINRCSYDYFSYPNSHESTFSAIELSTALRHYLTEDLYHSLGYEYSHRWYADWKVSMEDSRKGDNDREDNRNTITHKIRFFFAQLILKLNNELIFVDSNHKYQDYYDSWKYSVKPGIMYFLTDQLYTDISFRYKHTNYKNRRSSEDLNKKVRDNTYTLSAALYYDLTKNMTLEVSYSYSENDSNDPFNKYSGSIVSGGIYYSF